MSLTTCLRKAGDAIHADDKAAIIARARELRQAGTPIDQAARQAVDEQLAVVQGLLGDNAFGLTAPSAADLEAEQARATAAAKTDAAEQKRLADKAQADAERGEFTLTGSGRPADTGAAAGQGSLLSRSLEGRLFYAGTKYAKGKASAEQAMADAIEVLGFDPGIPVLVESRPDRMDMPMRYSLDAQRIYYNTAVKHARAEDVQTMVEEILHAVDHVGGDRTISATSDRMLAGGDLRAEIEAAAGKSAAMRDFLAYPLDEPGYTDTQVAAELFARVGALYHGRPDLLRLTAPTTFAAYEQALGNQQRDRRVQGEVQQLPGRGGGGQVLPEPSAQVRGDSRGSRRADRADAGGDRRGPADGLQRLRRRIAGAIGGQVEGARVDFGSAESSLRTSAGAGQPMFQRGDAKQSAMPRDAVQRVVSAITSAWRNGPRVVLLDSIADAPQSVRDELDLQQDAEGEPTAFVAQGDNSTVYLLLSQMDSPATVASALYHEALGHIGLRNAFPDLDKVLRQVAASLPDKIKAKAAEYGFDLKNEDDRLMAAEEVLAEIAQARPTSTWAQRAIAAIRAALRKIPGLEGLALTDSEIIVRFIEPARRFVEQGPTQSAVAPLAARPAFQRTSTHPAPAAPTDGGAWARTKARAAAALSPERVDTMIYTLQDRFIDLKRVEARIKELGGSIDEAYDAYLGEEMFHGRLAKRVQDFQRDEVKPLVKAMAARGVSIDELEQYLHARHAPERNAEMAKRNPNAAQLGELVNEAQRTLANTEAALVKAERTGSASAALKRAVTMARNEVERYRGAQPWTGSEEDRLSLSGMSDAEAARIIADLSPEKRADMEALAERIDAMARGTRQAWVDYGLEKRSTVGAMERTYQHYVPLFREEAGSDSFPAHPIGSGFSTRGPASRRAMGSTKAVSNIIGHLVMQREAALTRGEKNRVAQQFYTLAAVNPTPDWWALKSRATVRFINERTGLVEERPDPQWAQQPNVFVARFDGDDHYVVMNEDNPQAVRLAGALKNLDMADLGGVMNALAKLTRYFASINTQYNPVFGLVNLTRDVQAAAVNLSSTPLAGKQADVTRGVLPALRAIYREERGKAPTNQQWTDLWEQFQQDGGKTGFRDLFRTADERTKALQKELDALDRGMAGKAAHAVLDWLTHYNDAIENSLRLSAYKVALDSGMSRQQAASLAKNLTVNFNRKGKIARETGALYAFFNAAVQGTDRMVKTLAGPRGRAIVVGGVTIGVLTEILGRGLMGDDEWDKIPQFVKERALVIPTGPTSYVTIPMPLGLHVLPNLGRLAAEAALSESATVAGRVGDMASIMVEAFNPIGTSSTIAQTLAPTVADPFVALWENRDWTGRKIAIPNMSELDRQPGHQRAKDSASSFSMGVSKALNRITGGDEFIPGAISWSPDQIDYVIGTLTGGLGRELMKAQQTVTAPILGNDLPLHRVPVVSRFVGSTEGVSGNSEVFYRNLERVYSAENQHRGLARSQRQDQATEWLREHPEAALGGMGRKTQKLMSVLRDRRERLQKDQPDGWREDAAEAQRQMAEAMTRFNREVSARRRVETAESVP